MKLGKISISSIKDISLVKKAINYNTWLLCGNNPKKQALFKKILLKKCNSITVVPSDTLLHGSNGVRGYCCADADQNFDVVFWGNQGSPNEKGTIHTAVHEMCHAVQHVASYILKNPGDDYVFGNHVMSTHGSTIIEKSGNDRFSDAYGTFFCETITDILTNVELFYLDKKFIDRRINADNILKYNYSILDGSNMQKFGYTIYLSIARLAIAAFSNVGSVSYDKIIQNGESIILAKNTRNEPVNDLLYGIMCNALYIENAYDKYMGNNAYYKLCKKLDYMLNHPLKNADVKEVMCELAVFQNKKVNDLLARNVITQKEATFMINDFNLVFNNLQCEYDAYLTTKDMKKIVKSSNKAS